MNLTIFLSNPAVLLFFITDSFLTTQIPISQKETMNRAMIRNLSFDWNPPVRCFNLLKSIKLYLVHTNILLLWFTCTYSPVPSVQLI